MSGKSYGSYRETFGRSEDLRSDDLGKRMRAQEERARAIREAEDRFKGEAPRTRAKAAEPAVQKVERHLAKKQITTPPREANTIHMLLVDNSGSNRAIADALKRAAGYMHAALGSIAYTSTLASIFFSDHRDGPLMLQEADYTTPTPEGEKILRASIDCIRDAGGQDAPEAIECALYDACKKDFGHISHEQRHLYLVTDVVAHGMGWPDDDGCPVQRDWRMSLQKVRDAFGTFNVIASGDNREMFNLQKQFIAPERLAYDLIDLATGGLSGEERNRLVPNAVLLLIARNHGLQAVEGFLMSLYEKWLTEPMYGSATKSRAQSQISAFAEYLEIEDREKQKLLKRVFGD